MYVKTLFSFLETTQHSGLPVPISAIHNFFECNKELIVLHLVHGYKFEEVITYLTQTALH